MNDNVRRTQLNSLTKKQLIGLYLRGVPQSNGTIIAWVGGTKALSAWQKKELVNSLLEIGWPGSYVGRR